MKSTSEAPVIVPYQVDWTFVALIAAPVVLFGMYCLAVAYL